MHVLSIDAIKDNPDAEEPSGTRRMDPERTKREILEAARQEFVAHGLSGARVDAIAARTRTAKRMIYYYFGSKDGLYRAVLEQAYADIRAVEQTLDLARLPPAEAVRRMVEFTFDYHEAHPDFIRLVSIENIHRGRHLAGSETARNLNSAVIETLGAILERGRREGAFRGDIDPIDLHMMISAFCFFRISNRYTFGTLFQRDPASPDLRDHHKRMIADAVVRLLEARGEAERLPRDARPARLAVK